MMPLSPIVSGSRKMRNKKPMGRKIPQVLEVKPVGWVTAVHGGTICGTAGVFNPLKSIIIHDGFKIPSSHFFTF